ncbi:Crp/Fnr family transcriptional regulator [Rhodocytophaga rosea]|uniref:Crp/Fnr family transcriptional regulator n=1 Tax=Rhodocytophaga rosea TaxID=2704465 RepID=A0A6C0GNN1_9BACT|nr:Crp/Fnr family transcriptional regulator [Rhodocytophaga rosea]QHT69202.1 Crp/Fnr family transcriptional regulator [Rhodocytophaga rosea]
MYSFLIRHLSRYISLEPQEITLLTESFKLKHLKKKDFLLHQGEVSRFETFVNKGCLRAFHITNKGEEHIVQFAVEDWWIGDMYSFLTQTPAMYTIEALEDCELLQIDKNGLEELYLKLPKMERFFRIIIQNAFVASQKRIISSMSQTADERYLAFIEKYPAIEQRIPQYQVAAYLGITPEFLSRIRKKFASK